MLKDFTKVAEMPAEVIEKYKERIPAELVQIWQEDGLGTFLDGYLKVVNPDEYLELVQQTYFRGENAIPIFVTAFGDVIVYLNTGFIDIVAYKNGSFSVMTRKMQHFLKFLSDESFTDDYFDLPLYQEAVAKYGQLDYEQCFGFVPLLALGGFKDVDHLKKVRIYEHILLITHFVGVIGD